MSVVTQRVNLLSKDFVAALRQAGGVLKNETKEAVAKASMGLDQLVLTGATRHNVVKYHVGAEDSYKAIVGALADAKKSFHIETFIWHDDESGKALAEALVNKVRTAKAAGGHFDAKVLIDSVGIKSGYGTKDKNILKYLQENGVEAKLFNPNRVSLKAMGVPITHRKIYLADGEKYLIGGRNVGDEYFKATYQHKWGNPLSQVNSYHDFLMTVQGDEAARVQGEFYKNWARAGGSVPSVAPKAVPAKGGHVAIQTFITDPLEGKTGVLDAHLKAIANAKREINVISPYFSDDSLVQAMIDAKQKNVMTRKALFAKATNKHERAAINEAIPELKVRALMPLAGERGKDLNYQMAMQTARQLLDGGVEVRLTTGGKQAGQAVERFSHFKGMSIDGELLSIGSANADYRTYHSNHEIINLVGDRKQVADFDRNVLKPDWDAAQVIDQAWLKQNSSWAERAFRRVAEAVDFLY